MTDEKPADVDGGASSGGVRFLRIVISSQLAGTSVARDVWMSTLGCDGTIVASAPARAPRGREGSKMSAGSPPPRKTALVTTAAPRIGTPP